MKVLVADPFGECMLDWCLRVMDDGHDVRWAVPENARTRRIGEGLVSRVRNWRDHAAWADLIMVVDNAHYMNELRAWRARGKMIIGLGDAAETWELDRDKGMAVLERAGIEVPTSKKFTDYDAAIAYVRKEGRRFVSKPIGFEADKALSYVSKDAADMVEMLRRWKKVGKLKGAFLLQEFIEGVEMGVAGWFGPAGFLRFYEENVEHKKVANDDRGPNCGEAGTVMRFVKKSKLADQVLLPLEDQLFADNYVGCIDINVIVDKNGQPWPLEHTVRLGWPSFHIQQALHKGDHVEWLYELAAGRDVQPFQLDEIVTGVVMGIGDYPHDKIPIEEVTGLPLRGVEPGMRDNIHICQMMAGTAATMIGNKVVDVESLVTCGTYALVATGTGKTVQESAKGAYDILKKIWIPGGNEMVRTDIGKKLKKQLPELQKHGYLEDLKY